MSFDLQATNKLGLLILIYSYDAKNELSDFTIVKTLVHTENYKKKTNNSINTSWLLVKSYSLFFSLFFISFVEYKFSAAMNEEDWDYLYVRKYDRAIRTSKRKLALLCIPTGTTCQNAKHNNINRYS